MNDNVWRNYILKRSLTKSVKVGDAFDVKGQVVVIVFIKSFSNHGNYNEFDVIGQSGVYKGEKLLDFYNQEASVPAGKEQSVQVGMVANCDGYPFLIVETNVVCFTTLGFDLKISLMKIKLFEQKEFEKAITGLKIKTLGWKIV